MAYSRFDERNHCDKTGSRRRLHEGKCLVESKRITVDLLTLVLTGILKTQYTKQSEFETSNFYLTKISSIY